MPLEAGRGGEAEGRYGGDKGAGSPGDDAEDNGCLYGCGDGDLTGGTGGAAFGASNAEDDGNDEEELDEAEVEGCENPAGGVFVDVVDSERDSV